MRAVLTAFGVLVAFKVLPRARLPRARGASIPPIALAYAAESLKSWSSSGSRTPAPLGLSGTAWREVLDHWSLRSPPTPIVARICSSRRFGAAPGEDVAPPRPKEPAQGAAALEIGIAAAAGRILLGREWAAAPLASAHSVGRGP